MKKLIDFFFDKLERAVAKIGDIINVTPTIEENRKARSPKMMFNYPPNSFFKKSKKEKVKVHEVYEHKGSGYKGKGNINRDAATFNQPRKGLFPGRNH